MFSGNHLGRETHYCDHLGAGLSRVLNGRRCWHVRYLLCGDDAERTIGDTAPAAKMKKTYMWVFVPVFCTLGSISILVHSRHQGGERMKQP